MTEESRVQNIVSRMSENVFITSIRKGLLQILPLIMVGAAVLAVLNLPIPIFQNTMDAIFGDAWRNIGLAMHKGTFEILSLAALLSITNEYAESFEIVKNGKLSNFLVLLVALCSYFTIVPVGEVFLEANHVNSRGLFTAIVVSLISTSIFVPLYTKMRGKRKNYTYDEGSLMRDSIRAIIPMLITVFLFAIYTIFISGWVAGGTDALMQNLIRLFEGRGGLFTTIAFVMMTQILWFFGLHGGNIMDDLSHTLFVPATEANLALVEAGQAPTHIFTTEFLNTFVYIGGAGGTIGLLVALIIAGKKTNPSKVARFSIFPGLFNINETLIYGLPIIFNVYYFIPFLFAPVLSVTITYAAMATGLVPLTSESVLWTTPVFLSGYVSTGSIAGILLQLVIVAVNIVIYIPFVKMNERHTNDQNKKVFKTMVGLILPPEGEEAEEESILARNDDIGSLARDIASDLEEALAGTDEENKLEIKYQPKCYASGEVFGVEALLRWNHPRYGYIAPPVTIRLADEGRIGFKLAEWIMSEAFTKYSHWRKLGYEDLNLSVNLSPTQLKEDVMLIKTVQSSLACAGITGKGVEFELTENAAVDQSYSTHEKMEKIEELGIAFSIDDFGMGNSSLLYIRDFNVDVVKIDMSLVRNITENVESQEIVRSIVALGNQLDISVVAEGVEMKSQVEKLTEIGCYKYQGFYFSKAITSDELIEYLKKHNAEVTAQS